VSFAQGTHTDRCSQPALINLHYVQTVMLCYVWSGMVSQAV